MNLQTNRSPIITSLLLFGLGFFVIVGVLVCHITEELYVLNSENNTEYEKNVVVSCSELTRVDSSSNMSDRLQFSNSTDDLSLRVCNDDFQDFHTQPDTWKRKSTLSKLWFILKKKKLRYTKLSLFISFSGVVFIIVGLFVLLNNPKIIEPLNDVVDPTKILPLEALLEQMQTIKHANDGYEEFYEKILTAFNNAESAQNDSTLAKINNTLLKTSSAERRGIYDNLQMPSPIRNIQFTPEQWAAIIKFHNNKKNKN